MAVVSAYFKYNQPTAIFLELLQVTLESYSDVLIGADVNAHSPMWHNETRNARGKLVEEFVVDLAVINLPHALHTFDKDRMGASNIDVTLVTQAWLGRSGRLSGG